MLCVCRCAYLIKYSYTERIKIKCETLESRNLKESESLTHLPSSTIPGKDRISQLEMSNLSQHRVFKTLPFAQYSERDTSRPR